MRLDDDMLMSGRLGDLARIQSLRNSLDGDFVWMRHEGREYVIQNPDLLGQIDELWSTGNEPLVREEQELAEGRGALLEQEKKDLARRREEIRQEQDRVSSEESRLSDEHSALFWRKFDLDIRLPFTESEEVACMLRREIDDIDAQLRDVETRQDRKEKEADELDRRMDELYLEEKELKHEENAIEMVQRQIDARRDDRLRTLDATLLRLLEQAIADGTVQPLK